MFRLNFASRSSVKAKFWGFSCSEKGGLSVFADRGNHYFFKLIFWNKTPMSKTNHNSPLKTVMSETKHLNTSSSKIDICKQICQIIWILMLF